MTQRNASFLAATAAGWLGIAALTVLLLFREVAPYPRWDVIACLGVVAAAALWWLWQARERGGRAGGDASGSAARTTRGWWPLRRLAWTAAAMTGLLVPFVLLLTTAESSTPRLAAIGDGTPTVSRAEVREVHGVQRYSGRSGNSYTSDVTVALQGAGASGDGGSRPYRATVRAFEPAKPGDLAWALHARDDPDAGVVLDTDADELRALLGESVSPLSLLAVGGLGLCAAVLTAAAFRAARPERLARPFRKADGVRVLRTEGCSGGSAGRFLRYNPRAAGNLSRSELHPALRLGTPEGPVDLFVDRSLDPGALSAELGGSSGRLYRPDGEGGSSAPGGAVPAFLILDDGRYVYGRTAPPAPSAGEPVSQLFSLPDGLRAVGPYVIWDGHTFRPLVFGLGLAFASASALATGAGSDAGYAGGLGWPLLAVAVAFPLAGLMFTARRVTLRLRAVQERTQGAEPADPQANVPGKADAAAKTEAGNTEAAGNTDATGKAE